MGLGRFGGGIGVAAWLAEQGVAVTVTDRASPESLGDSVRALDGRVGKGRVRYRLGEHRLEDIEGCELLVVNPAVARPAENEWIACAQRAGASITTEIVLAIDRLPARGRVVGVTGTAGKSTTSTMIARGLETAHRVVLGGNLGGSLLDTLASIDSETWVVLELSSAMLWWINEGIDDGSRAPENDGWSPGVAVVTNFFANHLDWHGSADAYARAKQSLFAHQRPGDTALLGGGVEWATPTGVCRVRPCEWAHSGPLAPGAHNRVNAALALTACEACGVDIGKAATAVGAFAGLPHRLERLGAFEVKEDIRVVAINDSKCSTPEGAALAVDALAGEGRIRLIAGGADKGVPLGAFAAIADRVARVYTIGTTGTSIAAIARGACMCGTLERAVNAAIDDASDGDVVLLSPGCASWDQFVNFEARGEAFARSIRSIACHGDRT